MVYHYLKYYITPLLAPIGMVGMFLGGFWMWLGFVELLIICNLESFSFSKIEQVASCDALSITYNIKLSCVCRQTQSKKDCNTSAELYVIVTKPILSILNNLYL